MCLKDLSLPLQMWSPQSAVNKHRVSSPDPRSSFLLGSMSPLMGADTFLSEDDCDIFQGTV